MHILNDQIGLRGACEPRSGAIDKTEITFEHNIAQALSPAEDAGVFQVGPPCGIWLCAGIDF